MQQLNLVLPPTPSAVLEPDPTMIVFEKPPSLQGLMDGYNKLNGEKWPRRKVTLVFKQPVSIPLNGRQFKEISSAKVHFFMSREKEVCYAARDHFSSGYLGHHIPLDQILSMSLSSEGDYVKEVLAIAGRIYPGAWEDLKKEIEDAPAKWLKERKKPKYISMASVFPPRICEEIRKAFETRGTYRYSLPGTKRKRSVEMHPCDDGLWRAWYSSEYSGCMNGSYYLLINPKTALYYENG